MRNIVLGISLFVVVVLGLFGLVMEKENKEYLRIHIRADSNSDIDQQVKYKVKEKVVEFLTPLIESISSKEQAEEILSENLKEIEKVSNNVLEKNGFAYNSSAVLMVEEFPTRTYEDLTLEKGYYKALIINLGSGKGDNWWCVVYPPLCFTNTTKVQYKSLIIEGIEKFFN